MTSNSMTNSSITNSIARFVRRVLVGCVVAVAGLGVQAGFSTANAYSGDPGRSSWGVAHTDDDQGNSDANDVTPATGGGLFTAYSVHGSW